MDQTKSNYLKIDVNQYKKISKKLVSNLNKTYFIEQQSPIKLQQTQELLASAFGFRNQDALLKYFNKEKIDIIAVKENVFLNNFESNDILSIFLNYLNDNSQDIWRERAVVLITTLLNSLFYMREQDKDFILDVAIINHYLILPNLIDLYKTRKDFPTRIRSTLGVYLKSLPGFQESTSRQSDTVIDQHGYLQMQFNGILDFLLSMEKADPIIITPSWYHAVYDNKKSMSTMSKSIDKENIETRENDYKIIYKKLSDNNIDKFYDEFSEEKWESLFIPKNNSVSGGGRIVETTKYSPEVNFVRIEEINPIKKNSAYQNSWLADDEFHEILYDIVKNKEFKTYYFSDLMLYGCKIINRKKQMNYIKYIRYLMSNYHNILKYSQHFSELANKSL